MKRLLWTLLALLLSWPVTAGDVPRPAVPKGQGDRCVEETGFMRRNHMVLLKHQRDATVHQGIRTRKHALKECLSCHQTADADGKAVGAESEKHFCSSCHKYAAVSVDCWECHASKPETGRTADLGGTR